MAWCCLLQFQGKFVCATPSNTNRHHKLVNHGGETLLHILFKIFCYDVTGGKSTKLQRNYIKKGRNFQSSNFEYGTEMY
jgi:hypothetical protein